MKNKKVFILGMARSGFEAAKILAPDNEVFITDMKEQKEEDLKELESLGVSFEQLEDPIDYLDSSFDVVVKNPGIKYTHPVVLKAHTLNIPVINEMELGFLYLKKDVNVIGVTGSNGKTTTVTLISKMLEEDGKKVYLGGNIGVPFCSFVKEIQSKDYLVLEISDHQLCDMYQIHPNVSVLTNIYQVHLDFHDSFERYKEMKKKIFMNQTLSDIAIINKDNEESLQLTSDIQSHKEYFSTKSESDAYIKDNAIYYKDNKIIDCSEIKLKGIHNYENVMASILAVKHYSVKDESIVNVLKEFGGVEHRIEYVSTINGISFYNDSKATNCESTKIALSSFQNPTCLILGGLDRGHSFDELKEYMNNVKLVTCYGETKNRIKEFCDSIQKECIVCDTLTEATKECFKHASGGDVILLSPACASWDQYESFEIRGNEFKKVIKELSD